MKARILTCSVLLVLLAGCNTSPVLPASGKAPAGKTLKAVETAITSGVTSSRWVVTKKEGNVIEAALNTRGHSITVTIPYTKDSYEIVYKDSTNMKYNSSSNKIHRKYNMWVAKLNQAIQRQLSAL